MHALACTLDFKRVGWNQKPVIEACADMATGTVSDSSVDRSWDPGPRRHFTEAVVLLRADITHNSAPKQVGIVKPLNLSTLRCSHLANLVSSMHCLQ